MSFLDWLLEGEITETLTRIEKKQEEILATFQEFKAMVESLIALFETFMTKVQGMELIDPVDMAAAVSEVQAEIDKIKGMP